MLACWQSSYARDSLLHGSLFTGAGFRVKTSARAKRVLDSIPGWLLSRGLARPGCDGFRDCDIQRRLLPILLNAAQWHRTRTVSLLSLTSDVIRSVPDSIVSQIQGARTASSQSTKTIAHHILIRWEPLLSGAGIRRADFCATKALRAAPPQ